MTKTLGCWNKAVTMATSPDRPTPEQIARRIAQVRPDTIGIEKSTHEHLEERALECRSLTEFLGNVQHDRRHLARYRQVWKRVRGS